MFFERLPFGAVVYEKPWGVRLRFGVLNRLNFLWIEFQYLTPLNLIGEYGCFTIQAYLVIFCIVYIHKF